MARSSEDWGGADLAKAIQAAKLAAQTVEACGRTAEAKQLREAAESAQSMRFAIGVVGRTKRGKSTLINGILGRRDDLLAPVEKAPATNVVTCFASGDQEQAWVVFSADGEPRKAEPISYSDIKGYACEDQNPDNEKGVSRIDVVGPFAQLPRNVVLVDTPGSHNALSPVHGEILLNYLPRLDVVIFLISADAPLVEAELELLRCIRDSDIGKIFFAINKVDKVEPDELSEGLAHNKKVLAGLGIPSPELFPITAKTYWQTGQDPGVERLLEAMHRLARRLHRIAHTLRDGSELVRDSVQATCVEELALCEKTDEELRHEIAATADAHKRLSANRPSRERRFRREWADAVSACEDALPGIRSKVLAECRRIVEETNALNLAPLGQTIHTTIAKKIDDALQPHLERMRSGIEEATKALEVDFNMQLKSLEGAEEAVMTTTSAFRRNMAIAGSGVLPAIGAAVCTQVPGMVATAIVSAAPAVTALTLNPISWVMALGTGTAAGSAALAAGTAGVLLSPVAAIGAPALLGYAGYKIAMTWVARNAQNRDELNMAVRDRIEQLVGELRTNLSRLKRKDEDILAQFNDSLEEQIDSHRVKLEEYVAQRPAPARIEQLRQAVALLTDQTQMPVEKRPALPQPLL